MPDTVDDQHAEAGARRRPEPEPGPLDIVFEDDHLLVLNKPAGMVVHPTYRNWTGTLLNRVLWRLRGRADAAPGLVSRLDKGTSGLVALALTPGGHATLQRAMAAGRIRKQYLAVVAGTPDPPAGRIDLPLGRDPADRRRVIVTGTGAASATTYETLGASGGVALLGCALVTGRTHQIRVHLAAAGTPIVGDAVYGTPHPAIDRPALHAWRLALPHPASGEMLAFASPPPADFTALLAATGLPAPS